MNPILYDPLRVTTALLLAPLMALTGFRFSKRYRYGVSRYHRLVYALVSTPTANAAAHELRYESDVHDALYVFGGTVLVLAIWLEAIL